MHDHRDRSLAGIVNDLWGASVPESTAESAPVQEASPAAAPLTQLWATADPTVDWTDALVHDRPVDGLTPPEKWAFYHRHAAAVLEGDPAAYSEVLYAADPLADLKGFVQRIEAAPVSADLMHVCFTPADPAAQSVAAVALRAARDLFALLPLQQVRVEATNGPSPLLDVTFTRADLLHVRFAFIDPVEFIARCGGKFCLPGT